METDVTECLTVQQLDVKYQGWVYFSGQNQ